MDRLIRLSACLAATLISVAAATAQANPDVRFKNGIALAEIHPGHDSKHFETALGAIRELGAGWTLIPVYGFVDSAAAPGVDLDMETPPARKYVAFVRGLIRSAHRQGLSVLVIPYVNVRNGADKDWRGNIRPPDWTTWFDSYRSFLGAWVDVCRSEKVAMMAVGAELVSSEWHTSEWRRTIADARKNYAGRLIYSCNWDHYREVGFHDALDAVGLSGYYSLPYDAPLTQASVESNWREVKSDLIQFSHQVNRSLIFTEIGYPSMRGAARDPWNYTIDGQPDAGEQARSLKAFINVWSGTPELEGVFFWNYSPFRGGAFDTSYSINDKPAGQVVRSWFSTLDLQSDSNVSGSYSVIGEIGDTGFGR